MGYCKLKYNKLTTVVHSANRCLRRQHGRQTALRDSTFISACRQPNLLSPFFRTYEFIYICCQLEGKAFTSSKVAYFGVLSAIYVPAPWEVTTGRVDREPEEETVIRHQSRAVSTMKVGWIGSPALFVSCPGCTLWHTAVHLSLNVYFLFAWLSTSC